MGWSRDTIRKVAKRTGYPVVEAWSRHNKGSMGTIYGPMLHHTGTPDYVGGDYPTLRIVRDGRPGLENSLCMFGIGRSGTIYLINDKISWHAGTGEYRGIRDGNGCFAGIEAEGPYRGAWPAREVDAYQRLTASILLECRRGIEWAPRHADFALPRGRKTDFYGINVATFRGNVQKYLNNPALLGVKGGVEELNAKQEALLREVVELARAVDRNLTPGKAGVRFPGDIYTKVTQSRDSINALKSQVAAQQATINKLVDLVSRTNGLSVDQVRKAVQDAIKQGIVEVNVTVDDTTP